MCTLCPCSVNSILPSTRSSIFVVESLDTVMRKLPAGWKDKLFTTPLWTGKHTHAHFMTGTDILLVSFKLVYSEITGLLELILHSQNNFPFSQLDGRGPVLSDKDHFSVQYLTYGHFSHACLQDSKHLLLYNAFSC